MPNAQTIHAQQGRLDIIHMAIKRAEGMVDGKTYLEMDGERSLLTLPELNARYDTELAKLRSLA